MFLVLHPLIQVPRLGIRAERKKELHLVGKCVGRGEAGGAVGGRELFHDSRLEAALLGCRPSGPASLLLLQPLIDTKLENTEDWEERGNGLR